MIDDRNQETGSKCFINTERFACLNTVAQRSQVIVCIREAEFLYAQIFRNGKEVIDKNVCKNFAELLIEKKRELLRLRAFYEQLIDATEIYIENENELLDEKSYKLFRLFRDKAVRYKENTDILRESVTHLWDAYQTSIDARQNEIMKLFTVVTSVFLPMTVIVGWYGMNFKYMPELSSRFGYPYVIFLNVAVVFSLIYIFKRKRWI